MTEAEAKAKAKGKAASKRGRSPNPTGKPEGMAPAAVQKHGTYPLLLGPERLLQPLPVLRAPPLQGPPPKADGTMPSSSRAPGLSSVFDAKAEGQ